MASLGGTDAAESTKSSSGGFSFDSLNGAILQKFIQVIEAAAILVVVYFLILWVKSRFEKIEAKHEQQKTVLNLLEKISTGFILVIGLTMALKTVGLDISLLVSVGLLGLSYGLKDVIKNYVAGILIFFKAPFKIGDIVKIKSFMGKVAQMDLQSTTLKTFDNKDITIYNSDVMTQSIANYSRYPMRRMDMSITLGYGTDFEKALKVFDSILKHQETVLKRPKYSLMFKKFTESGVTLDARFWVKYPCNMLKIRSELAWQFQKAFDEISIVMPYSKSIEVGEDYTMTEDRVSLIKAFYSSALFTAVAEQVPVVATVDANGVAIPEMPEFIDEDEPL